MRAKSFRIGDAACRNNLASTQFVIRLNPA